MECVKCDFENPEQARFCAGCGVGLAAIECHHCATENNPGSRFCNSCGQLLANSPSNKSNYTPNIERRMLTVLFCDLVDSTALIDSLDPELSRSFIREYQAVAKDVIENFGGRITEYLGDGIVAQFTRHETNAERAINAALQIIQSLSQNKLCAGDADQKAMVRCGIATGMAVVGDMLGDDDIRSESAIGLPLNLAARIQSLAGENQVAIGGATHRLVRGLFEFEDIGQHALKGIKEAQQVWRVVAKQSISSRFIAHAVELTPMINQTEILGQLSENWERCKQGDAKAIVFMGEAGIGKSRIIQEFTNNISVDYAHVEYQCSPYHTNTALYPIISGLEAAARFEHDDSNKVRVRKLEKLLRWSSDHFEHDMPAFVNLLSLLAEDKWPTPNLDPEEIKQWIFKAAINHLESLSAKQPLLIQVEDVHWIDPTTLELMQRLAEDLAGHPVLLLVTARHEFSSSFTEHPHVSVVEIKKLSQQHMKLLLEELQGESSLLDPVLDEIVQRTDGIPLFMEELSKSLLESAGPDSSEVLAHKDIPATLHDSLLSRLDHLPDESRSIALLASVLGRDFSYDLLKAINSHENINLYELLSPLLEAQLVIQRKAPPHAEFSFKHALVRDVAYETLLQSDRVAIHKQIAELIEVDFQDISRKNPELVAHHFTEGNCYDKAVKYWLEAGKKASRSSANIEARSHFDKGLSILKEMPNIEQASRYELEILLGLGPIYMSIYGTGASQTHDIYLRALALSQDASSSNADLRFIALWNRWRMSIDEGLHKVVIWADELLDHANKTKKVEQLLQAHHCQWGTLYNLGDQRACVNHVDAGLSLYDEKKHVHHASVYGGHDPKVCGYSQSALSLWFMGEYQEAKERIKKGQVWADHINHLGTHLHQIDISLIYNKFTNNPREVLNLISKLNKLIDLDDYQDYSSKVKIYSDWANGMLSDNTESLSLLEQGMAEHAASGTSEDTPVFLEMSAQLKRKFGDSNGALLDIENAIESANHSGVIYWNAELYRIKAELLIAKKDKKLNDEAETNYLSAIEIAAQQRVITLELRAAIGLAKLYLSLGNKEKSLSTIKPILDKFTFPPETDDVRTALAIIQDIH